MKNKNYYTAFLSPIGFLHLRCTQDALTAVFMEKHRHQPPLPPDAVNDHAPFREAQRELEEFFAGERREFSLTTQAMGTSFQSRVWMALWSIPYGETISYGELARVIGHPGAARAVGMASGRNPLSIVIPCHRVIGATGSLTGYGGGLERKRFLLALEAGRESINPGM